MYNKKIGLLILIASWCPLMPAQARESSNGALTISLPELANSKSTAILREIEIFGSVPVSLRDVIAIAEKRAAGTKAIDISFDARNGQSAYKVKTLLNGEIWACAIDASTGSVIGEGVVTSVSKLDLKDKAELIGFATAKTDLSEAAAIAETHGGGKAISAGLEYLNSGMIFSIVVVADGVLKQITISPQSKGK